MKKRWLLTLFSLLLSATGTLWAAEESTDPYEGKVYRIKCASVVNYGNNGYYYWNRYTAPTQTEGNQGEFTFEKVDGVDGAYYIKEVNKEMYVTYTAADSYTASLGKSFVSMSMSKEEGSYFKVIETTLNNNDNTACTKFRLYYETKGEAEAYLAWYFSGNGGKTLNDFFPIDGDDGLNFAPTSNNSGTGWLLEEKQTYTFHLIGLKEDGTAAAEYVTIGGTEVKDGGTYLSFDISTETINTNAPEGYTANIETEGTDVYVYYKKQNDDASTSLTRTYTVYIYNTACASQSTITINEATYGNGVVTLTDLKEGDITTYAKTDGYVDVEVDEKAGTIIVSYGDTEYTVKGKDINGDEYTNGGVSYNGISHAIGTTMYAYNLEESDLKPFEVEGMDRLVAIDNTVKTVTVTYVSDTTPATAVSWATNLKTKGNDDVDNIFYFTQEYIKTYVDPLKEEGLTDATKIETLYLTALAAQKDLNSYYMPKDKSRYLIQMKNIDRRSGEYPLELLDVSPIFNETEGRYLIAYADRIMNVVEDEVNYYGAWDFTKQSDGQYVIQNEGVRDVEPTETYFQNGSWLNYNGSGALCYVLGSDKSDPMEFVPNGEGFATLKATKAPSTKYAYMCYSATDWDGSSHTNGTHVICGGFTNYADNMYFACKEITKERDLELYNHAVEQLNGYVGGVVTTDIATYIAAENPLSELANQIKNDREALGETGTTTTESTTTEESGTTTTTEVNGSKLFKNVYNLMTDDKIKNANYTLTLETDQIFYIENLDRPDALGRLAYAIEYGYKSITSTPNKSTVAQSKYAQWSLEETGTTGSYYVKNVGMDQYLAGKTLTTEKANAAKVSIKYVAPGIVTIILNNYQWTIGGYNDSKAKYYFNGSGEIELSALFKIKCYNKIDVTLGYAGEESGKNPFTVDGVTYYSSLSNYFSTFCYHTPTEVDHYDDEETENTSSGDNDYVNHIHPYYADPDKVIVTNADGNDPSKWDVTVVLTPVAIKKATSAASKEEEDIFVMQADQGYILRGNVNKTNSKIRVSAITINEGGDGYVSTTNNMLRKVLYDELTITDDNFDEVLVLSYVPTTKEVSEGSGVYGVGLGFYRLNKGKTIAKHKAYLSWSALKAAIEAKKTNNETGTTGTNDFFEKDEATGTTQSVRSLSIVFEDIDGTDPGTEDRIETPIIWNAQPENMNIYDLNGRIVDEPQPGKIYILNGKKIMF